MTHFNTTSEESPDFYEESWSIISQLPEAFRSAGIPDHEPMPAIADFLMIAVFAIAGKEGLAEFAAQALIERQQKMLQEYMDGKLPGFDKPDGKDTPNLSIH